MYLLLIALGLGLTVLPSPFGDAIGFTGFFAVATLEHVLALWCAYKSTKATRVLNRLAVLDFMFGVIGSLGLLRMWSLGALLLGVMGLKLCLRAYSFEQSVPAWLLPVRGEWARRWCIACGILFMQPLAIPGLIALAIAPSALAEPFEGNTVAKGLLTAWLLTLPLHYSPLYRRLVAGDRAHEVKSL